MIQMIKGAVEEVRLQLAIVNYYYPARFRDRMATFCFVMFLVLAWSAPIEEILIQSICSYTVGTHFYLLKSDIPKRARTYCDVYGWFWTMVCIGCYYWFHILRDKI